MRSFTARDSFFHTYALIALAGIFLLSGLYITAFGKTDRFIYKKLSFASAPTVYYPGPLTFHLRPADVLGAQTPDPRDIITFVNEERLKRGVPALKISPVLTKAAQMRADVILKYENFSHQDPNDNIKLDTVLPLLQYPFIYASENIGMGDSSGKDFVNGFMNSPSHRDNLLDPKLVETGVAIVSGPYKQYYVNIAVQLFAIPVSQKEYLGYSDKDREDHKKLLGDLSAQLTHIRQLIGTDSDRKEYYENWEKLLVRQLEIASYIYEAMKKQEPLIGNFVALVSQYNTNIDTIRKLPRS